MPSTFDLEKEKGTSEFSHELYEMTIYRLSEIFINIVRCYRQENELFIKEMIEYTNLPPLDERKSISRTIRIINQIT